MSKVICPEPGSQLIIGSVTFSPVGASDGCGTIVPNTAWYESRIKELETELATLEQQRREDVRSRPTIVCLCGSTRFIHQFAVLQWELEKDGYITLGLHLLPESYPGVTADHMAETEGVKEQMDELHKRKIDLADQVLVLNIGGYIGESTRSEIDYATAHGKPVKYIEQHDCFTAPSQPKG